MLQAEKKKEKKQTQPTNFCYRSSTDPLAPVSTMLSTLLVVVSLNKISRVTYVLSMACISRLRVSAIWFTLSVAVSRTLLPQLYKYKSNNKGVI